MNIIDWLEENEVVISKTGTNVSPGWIAFRCMFCDDHSNHLGIRVKDLKCSCWRCGGHSIITVIQEIASCSRASAIKTVKSFEGIDEYSFQQEEQHYHVDKAKKYFTKIPYHLPYLTKQYINYLRKRNFMPKRIGRKYELMAGGPFGRYKFRILIPVYMNRRLVTFTTRAIFDEMEPKYLNAMTKESLIRPRDCIYNYDSIIKGGDALVLEGPADVWRWGNGSCSTIGLQITKAQLSALREKEIHNLFIMMDAERFAQRVKAEELARLMGPWVGGSLELLEANWKKDLGDFSPSEANKLRNHLNFKGIR